MVLEKKIEEECGESGVSFSHQESSVRDCVLCDRPKSSAVCQDCKHVLTEVRIRRVCDDHPKQLFTKDTLTCPKCEGKRLLELGVDDIPSDLLDLLRMGASSNVETAPLPPPAVEVEEGNNTPEQPTSRTSSSSSTSSSPVSSSASSSSSLEYLSFECSFRPEGISATNPPAVYFFRACSSPSPSPTLLTPPTSPGCVCGRKVKFVICTCCGWCAGKGTKKFVPCPKHPDLVTGIQECPDCLMDKDVLEEEIE